MVFFSPNLFIPSPPRLHDTSLVFRITNRTDFSSWFSVRFWGKLFTYPVPSTFHFVSLLFFIILPERAHMQTMRDLQILDPLPSYFLSPPKCSSKAGILIVFMYSRVNATSNGFFCFLFIIQ